MQACQGQATDPGSKVDNRRRHTSTDSTPAYKIPNYCDFLIFQASFWDHFSFRSPESGSWFIQSLCSAMDRSEAEDSLMDILLDVSRHVAVNKVYCTKHLNAIASCLSFRRAMYLVEATFIKRSRFHFSTQP